MVLSDQELGMLEQLTYLNHEVSDAAGLSGYDLSRDENCHHTVGELLERFDEKALQQLEQTENVGFTRGKEWANIIRYLQNSKMKDLVMTDTMKKDGRLLAYCFVENEGDENAVVAFKGTTGAEEWADNALGLNQADTQNQLEAAEFIESLPYSDITVTGHSKGGNKAMYVTLVTDKVSRCVSFDGQGFSKEFLDKYWAEIQTRGGNIKNFSLSTDYVHLLMFPVPNAQQIYCQGYGVGNFLENHCPAAFFTVDENGNLLMEQNGQLHFTIVEKEAEAIRTAHELTTFLMNNASKEELAKTAHFMSEMLPCLLAGQGGVEGLLELIRQDPEAAGIILAYLAKFAQVKDLSSKDLEKIFPVLGEMEKEMLADLEKEMQNDERLRKLLATGVVAADGLLGYIIDQLQDGKSDEITKWLLNKLCEEGNINIDAGTIWDAADETFPNISTDGGMGNYRPRTGKILDFSQNTYDALRSTIDRINEMGSSPADAWKSYNTERWYMDLPIELAVNCIDTFYDRVYDINQECSRQFEEIFENARQADLATGNQLRECREGLQRSNARIEIMVSNIQLRRVVGPK